MWSRGEVDVVPVGGWKLCEQVRRIGLAGEALAQLRADYERKPSAGVCEAIRRKIWEIAELGAAFEEELAATDDSRRRAAC